MIPRRAAPPRAFRAERARATGACGEMVEDNSERFLSALVASLCPNGVPPAKEKLCLRILGSSFGRRDTVSAAPFDGLAIRRKAHAALEKAGRAEDAGRFDELFAKFERLAPRSGLAMHAELTEALVRVALDAAQAPRAQPDPFRYGSRRAVPSPAEAALAPELATAGAYGAGAGAGAAPPPSAAALPAPLAASLDAEQTILRELIFALQGIDGSYLKREGDGKSFRVGGGLALDAGQLEVVRSCCEAGWLYHKVSTFARGSKEAGAGLVAQAFLSGLQEELSDYFRLIAVLEARLSSAGGLTLRRLVVWLQDPMLKLRLMAALCDAARGLKGGALASVLHSHSRHGDPFVSGFCRRLLRKCLGPTMEQMVAWLAEGELLDPHGEFFVQGDAAVPEERLWADGYFLEARMLPSFLPRQLAEKVLSVGKALNFLRKCCGDRDFRQAPAVIAKLHSLLHGRGGGRDALDDLFDGELTGLRNAVAAAGDAVNRRLKRSLLEDWGLLRHLDALKRFLLLGQGDFVVGLMDTLGPELNKRAAHVYRHNLTGAVDSALRASNAAQLKDADVLDRVGVRLLEPSAGDSGWEIFTLDYYITKPLDGVLHARAQLQYRRIFHFLWRMKRAEWMLAEGWRQHMAAVRLRVDAALPALRGLLHAASLAQAQMVHLASNLSSYVMFEVLETEWTALQRSVDAAADMDAMLAAHEAYLGHIREKLLMNEREAPVNKKMSRVLDAIGGFCKCQNALFADVFTEMARRGAASGDGEDGGEDAAAAYAEDWDQGRVPQRFLNSIQGSAREFEAAISELVEALQDEGEAGEKLRTLASRLDFNDFFAARGERGGD